MNILHVDIFVTNPEERQKFQSTTKRFLFLSDASYGEFCLREEVIPSGEFPNEFVQVTEKSLSLEETKEYLEELVASAKAQYGEGDEWEVPRLQDLLEKTFPKCLEEIVACAKDRWGEEDEYPAGYQDFLDAFLEEISSQPVTYCGYCSAPVGDSALCEGCGSDWSGNFEVR